MRFLADENFPAAAVAELSRLGHDVAWIRVVKPGASDADVLAIAVAEGRVLLTFDKDFGELARATALPPACGVVLVRIAMPRPNEASSVASLISARSDWAGRFSVIEPGRVRMRPLAG